MVGSEATEGEEEGEAHGLTRFGECFRVGKECSTLERAAASDEEALRSLWLDVATLLHNIRPCW